MIAGLWRVERCQVAETGQFEMTYGGMTCSGTYQSLTSDAQRLAYLYEESQGGLAILSRYEVRHELAFYRALRELIKLRKLGSNGTGLFDRREDEEEDDPYDWDDDDPTPAKLEPQREPDAPAPEHPDQLTASLALRNNKDRETGGSHEETSTGSVLQRPVLGSGQQEQPHRHCARPLGRRRQRSRRAPRQHRHRRLPSGNQRRYRPLPLHAGRPRLLPRRSSGAAPFRNSPIL